MEDRFYEVEEKLDKRNKKTNNISMIGKQSFSIRYYGAIVGT